MKLIHADLILDFTFLHALLLSAKDRLVEITLGCAEFARYGECSSDVTRIH
jgi:hypothetical protein